MDPRQQILCSVLATQLWSWAHWVFKPAQWLREQGLYEPGSLGEPPPPGDSPGGGPDLSARLEGPVLLPDQPEGYHDVEVFDEIADHYHEIVRPFSQPILDETRALMSRWLGPKARIFDPSAGTGHAAIALAEDYAEGEVVAADLAREMVVRASENAAAAGRRNMAFFQADVSHPPPELEGYFDAIFCCLSFHHYPDGPGAARAFRRVLAPGGKCFIADGGPRWYIELARPLSVLADPGFVQHRTGEEFQQLLLEAGFSSVYWVEALPGIGVTVGSA